MFRDFENNLKHDQVLDPVVLTDSVNGGSIDMKDYRHCVFYALIGESGDTLSESVYVELELEDSDDDSTFADCADALVTNSVTGNNTGTFGKIDAAAEDDTLYMTEYKGAKRYVRPVVSLTGTHTNGIPVAIMALRSGDQSMPVTQ